jgi:hypothetical protein
MGWDLYFTIHVAHLAYSTPSKSIGQNCYHHQKPAEEELFIKKLLTEGEWRIL